MYLCTFAHMYEEQASLFCKTVSKTLVGCPLLRWAFWAASLAAWCGVTLVGRP